MMCVNYKHIMQILPLCGTDKGVCREESGSQGSNPTCFETLNILSPPGSSSSPGRTAIMMSPLLFLLHVPLLRTCSLPDPVSDLPSYGFSLDPFNSLEKSPSVLLHPQDAGGPSLLSKLTQAKEQCLHRNSGLTLHLYSFCPCAG